MSINKKGKETVGYSSVQGQHGMFYDVLRNRFYLKAIQETVKQESVVLDLGAGLGLHGLMANTCNAKKVYLVEPTKILDITKKVVEKNGLTGKIDCLAGGIENVSLPEKVDVIISVFTGNFLLSEDLLPSLFYARDKYLSQGGKMIPDRAKMILAPVSSADYYAKYIDCWSEPTNGIDYSLTRKYAVNTLYYDSPKNRDCHFLAAPGTLLELDFLTADKAACHSKIEINIVEDEILHGCIGWFDARVGSTWISTSPIGEQMHWSQVFLPVENPIAVKKGDTLYVELTRPESGDWSWVFEHNGRRQKHSTFLSAPAKMKELLKLTEGYKGDLSQKGQVTQEALRLLNGKNTGKDIKTELLKKYPQYFSGDKQVDIFVKNILENYT